MYYKCDRMLGIWTQDRTSQSLIGMFNQESPLYADFCQLLVSMADSCLYQLYNLAECTPVGMIHACELESLRLDVIIGGESL